MTNKEILAANLQRLLDAHGVSRQDLCAAIEVGYSTLADWLHARTYPRIDKLEAMANHLNVTVADLVEAPDGAHPAPDELTERLKALELTDADWEDIVLFIDFVAHRRKEKEDLL